VIPQSLPFKKAIWVIGYGKDKRFDERRGDYLHEKNL
jgi:hypothetical protein